MSLYDLMAAGHQGQCFQLLARRFLISEPQAAQAVKGLLPVLLPSVDAWISAPAGMTEFLEAMSRGGHEKTLLSATIFNNQFERSRGVRLLEHLRGQREFDGAAIARAADDCGLTYRVLVQMLPWVALLTMAALRAASEAPCRALLAARLGAGRKAAADPFGQVAELIAWESKGERPGVMANMLGSLFARPVASTSRLA